MSTNTYHVTAAGLEYIRKRSTLTLLRLGLRPPSKAKSGTLVLFWMAEEEDQSWTAEQLAERLSHIGDLGESVQSVLPLGTLERLSQHEIETGLRWLLGKGYATREEQV